MHGGTSCAGWCKGNGNLCKGNVLPLTTEVSLKPRLQWHHHLIEIQYWVCATLLDRMEGPLDKVPEKPNVSAAAKELICADVAVHLFFSLFPGYICQTGFSENRGANNYFLYWFIWWLCPQLTDWSSRLQDVKNRRRKQITLLVERKQESEARINWSIGQLTRLYVT